MMAELKNKEHYRKILCLLIPLGGVAFLLWYIKNSTCDVVYSDYIRLVNSYLPDVYDPRRFFVPDVLTRIPINYLERIINVELFGFSITFDRVLGAVSLGLAAWAFGVYFIRRRLGTVWFLLTMAVMFSLNKWEMITNGSGWSHFFAFACFYYHELVFDRVWAGEEKRGDTLQLILLPFLIILGTAGPYCAIYAVVMILSAAAGILRARIRKEGSSSRRYLVFLFASLIPLLLYILSNSFAVEEHAGATGRSLGALLADAPSFPVRFILKSLSGMVIGGEELIQWIEKGQMTDNICYLLGLFVAAGYLWALWLYLRHRLYERTLFPLMLLTGGALNHVLIFLSRYIFEKENYALSSRYALQFQVGILGIILTFALVSKAKEKVYPAGRAFMALFCIAILLGNGYTTYREIKKAPYREERFEQMEQLAPLMPFLSDEEMMEMEPAAPDLYEYRKGTDQIRNAFRILEENGLNVFRKPAS